MALSHASTSPTNPNSNPWPPPALGEQPPTSPPDPPLTAPPADRDGSAALWLGVLGAGLVAAAALIVGFAGRDTLGALGPAGGLAASAGATSISSRRLRLAAPSIAGLLEHLTRVLSAVAVTATAGAYAPWPVVLAAFGVTLAAASIHWRLGGSWATATMRALAVGALGTSVAATSPLPLGVMLAVGALAASVGSPKLGRRWLSETGCLLAAAAMLAPLGGTPGSIRIGDGTLARVGLRGPDLVWAAATAGVIAAAALIVYSGRRRAAPLVYLAIAGMIANGLVSLGAAGWPHSTTAIWVAVGFAGFQAFAAANRNDLFWGRTLRPVSFGLTIVSLPAAKAWISWAVITVAVDGADPVLAIAPLLLTAGYLLASRVDVESDWSIPAALAVAASVYVATASLTAVAAVAASVLLWQAWRRPVTTSTSVVAAISWTLGIAAQLVDQTALADGVAVVVIVGAAWGVGRAGSEGRSLAIIAAALGSSQAMSFVIHGDMKLAAAAMATGITGAVLVAGRRSDARTALTIPSIVMVLATGEFLESLHVGIDGSRLALGMAIAGGAIALVGSAGWWRGESWAAHVSAAAVVTAVAPGLVAAGATPREVVTAALIGGIGLAGISFVRPRYGAGDTAAMVALAVSFGFGVSATSPVAAWMAMTALGVVVALHGMCRLDLGLTGIGAFVAVASGIRLGTLSGADSWLLERLDAMGVSHADIVAVAVAALLAAVGFVGAKRAPGALSWLTWGPAAAFAGVYLVATIAAGPVSESRLVVALSLGIALASAGARFRALAPLVLGTLTVVASLGVASWTTLESLPVWVWMTVGGATLLGIAATLERRSTASGHDGPAIRHILTTFR